MLKVKKNELYVDMQYQQNSMVEKSILPTTSNCPKSREKTIKIKRY